MSDAGAAPMGNAVTAAEATETTGKQFAGKEASASPDLSKMTGAEAKAYIEAQKKEKNPIKEAVKSAAAKLTPKPKAEATDEAAKEAVEEAVRKMKLKDKEGKEFEVDEEEVKSTYLQRKEHQQAANKILQEGKAARRQAEEFISMMKDPAKFYETAQKLGHDPRKLAEEFLASKLEDEMMDPRDRELRDAKAKLKQIEDLEKQQKAALDAQRHDALKNKWAKDYSDQFVTALKETNLPPDKKYVGEMAKYVHRSAQIGFVMTAKEAAQLVKEDLINSLKYTTQQTDGETLIQILGDEASNKIRQYDTAKIRSPEEHLKTPEVQGQPRDRKVPHKRMTPSEWREFNRR